IRDDYRTPSTELQHSQHQHQEEEFRLPSLYLASEGRMHVLLVKAAFEWWVCQDQIEIVIGIARKPIRKAIAERVLVMDVRRIDSVQHQVHCRDTKHRHVEIEAVEHTALDVL